jgi:hypothetical protein
MSRTERIAKLRRDLAELRSRMQRIDHETFSAKREIGEIEAEIMALASERRCIVISFLGAVRVGARKSGVDMSQLHEHALAAIAEDVLATIRNTSEDKLREILRNEFLRGKHPSRYEGPPDDDWRHFLVRAVADFFEYGHDFKPKMLRLLKGGAS